MTTDRWLPRIATAFYLFVGFTLLLSLIALVLSVITGQWGLTALNTANIIVNITLLLLFRAVTR